MKTWYNVAFAILAFWIAQVNWEETNDFLKTITVNYDPKLDVIYFDNKTFVNRDGEDSPFLKILNEEAPAEGHPEGEEHSGGEEDEKYPPGSYMFYYSLIVACLLTCGAGVMSGLTVGYLSIDQLELEMKLQNGTEQEKKYALAVLPVLEDHHYLLVTLLLANALCMEALPIYLDAIVPSAYAILISVIAVLFFGEVIPQAICTGPQQIKIGAWLAPIIQLLKIVLGIIAYPIAKILDWVLGEHMTTRYSNNDLKALIELHSYHALETIDKAKDWKADNSGLQPYQTKMIKSVIDFKAGNIQKLMIPADRIFSLHIQKKMSNNVAKKVTKAGYSRIPVYEKEDKNRIIGILLIKTLIGLDLKDGKRISDLVNEGEVTLRKPIFVSPNEKFEGILKQFLKGKSHMAIVTDKPEQMEQYVRGMEDEAGDVSLLEGDSNIDQPDHDAIFEKEPAKLLGLLTLEDLIEFIIKEDILDEADYDKDLAENQPNIYLDKHRSGERKLSQLYMGNRGKIHDIVKNHLKETLDQQHKERFKKESSITISLDKKGLANPLIEMSEKKIDKSINGPNENKESLA